MSGILTPVVNTYTVGKGLVFFNVFGAGTQVGLGEDFLGDCKGLNVTVKTTQLDHYQSTGGVKILDQSAAIQADSSGQLMTENNSSANMARFFFGSSSTQTQTAAAVAATALPPVTPGLYYQIGATTANPLGVQNLNAAVPIVVTGPGGTPVYVAGTDYAVDYPSGRIQILLGGSITAASQPLVGYSTAAATKNRVISGTTPLEGSLRFVGNNITGTNRMLFMPWVKLIPNGSYELIGDKFIEMTFDVKALSLAGQPFVLSQDL